MKPYTKLFFAAAMLLFAASVNAQSSSFFQLPVIPDSIKTLQDRSDYMVEHYWDFCDLDKSFSARDKMADAFDTYLSFMPYASVQAVYPSIDSFMAKVGKKPANALFIGELAEAKLYSDSAQFQSDELFCLFVKNIISNKKIDKTSKMRYQFLYDVLTKSAPGQLAPKFKYTDLQGQQKEFEVDSTKIGTILFFNNPDCDDCNMARLRLDTDIITRKLVEGGKMQIVSIYASEPNSEWIEKALDFPQSWLTVASEDVNDSYDLRITPMFYVVNPNGAILLKTVNVNDIIGIMAGINAKLSQTPQTKINE